MSSIGKRIKKELGNRPQKWLAEECDFDEEVILRECDCAEPYKE